MPSPQGPEDNTITLRFGGGVHTRAAENQIDPRECAAGENFILDVQNLEFRRRPAITYLGTVPNQAEIRGIINLVKCDGTSIVLIQAEDQVYKWDGSSFITVGTCQSTAKLRGWMHHNWHLDDKVIITDLNKAQNVMEYDGTTLQEVSFTGGTNFRAKYCVVNNERAIFANIEESGTELEHLIVGSERGDYSTISVANRPGTSSNAEDPFFLVQPDNRAINGIANAFGQLIFSGRDGNLSRLTGADHTDFAVVDFYDGSAASGEEPMAHVGNDIIYGRRGRIEGLRDTERFGNVETDDISRDIADQLEDYTDWRLVYDESSQRLFCFEDNQSGVWVLHKPLRDPGANLRNFQTGTPLSPWMKWTTATELDYKPSAAMNVIHPTDGTNIVLAGSSLGNLYNITGDNGVADSGPSEVTAFRTSAMFSAKLEADFYHLQGYIRYRQPDEDLTAVLTFLFGGRSIFNEQITVSLPRVEETGPYWGGSGYWGGDFWWGAEFQGRLTRANWYAPGRSEEFQLKVAISAEVGFRINEILIKLTSAESAG